VPSAVGQRVLGMELPKVGECSHLNIMNLDIQKSCRSLSYDSVRLCPVLH